MKEIQLIKKENSLSEKQEKFIKLSLKAKRYTFAELMIYSSV